MIYNLEFFLEDLRVILLNFHNLSTRDKKFNFLYLNYNTCSRVNLFGFSTSKNQINVGSSFWVLVHSPFLTVDV